VGLCAIVAFLSAAWPSVKAQEHEIRIAAAADLKFAMLELGTLFEKQSGTKVDVT
jgi:ABC-type molybdate transport system substrate-binding protein